jgi:ArsR family transcriptional regulator
MSRSYGKALPRRWQGMAKVFTALGDEHRQRMLLMFEAGEELTIKDIAGRVPLSRTAATHHINVLRAARVLLAEKRGKEVFLRPNPEAVLGAIDGVRDYIKEELK